MGGGSDRELDCGGVGAFLESRLVAGGECAQNKIEAPLIGVSDWISVTVLGTLATKGISVTLMVSLAPTMVKLLVTTGAPGRQPPGSTSSYRESRCR